MFASGGFASRVEAEWNGAYVIIVSANAGTRRPKMSSFLGCLVSWLLAFLVSWCLCFLGGKEGEEGRRGTKEGGRKVRKEEVERSKEGRRGKNERKEGEEGGLHRSKMWPLGVENAPQKAPNWLPGGLWAAFGVPGGPLGGPRLIFYRF